MGAEEKDRSVAGRCGGSAARREAIAHFEPLGEAQLFQLPHPTFEHRHIDGSGENANGFAYLGASVSFFPFLAAGKRLAPGCS